MKVMSGSMPSLALLAALATVGVARSGAQNTPVVAATPVAATAAEQASPQAASPSETPAPPPEMTVSAQGLSQVRIVRLSQVRGEVRLDRQVGHTFEVAFVNLPIVAGERLQTLDGLAEVEFEDNSSIRLTPNSLVEFPVLGRDAAGATSTTVKLLRGSLYVSLAAGKGADGFIVQAGEQRITLSPSTHLRLDLASQAGKLVVFKGSATVAGSNGTLEVSKKKAASFDLAATAAPALAHNDGASTFDKWDKDEVEYHEQRAASMGFAGGAGGSPYAYGLGDLSYYGSFTNFGSCGSMWRPYLATASWNPYGSGVWAYYPGAGYSWVSPYPWGWTPYHSGNWAYCPNAGWGWQPTGGWNGLNNLVSGAARTKGAPGRPVYPPPPGRGEPSLVAVNTKLMPISNPGTDGAFVFRSDSAGLGVPRGVFSNLGKLSQSVAQHGTATTSVSEGQAQRAMIPASSSRASLGAPAGGGAMGASRASGGGSSSMSMSSASSASVGHAGGGASGGSGGGHH
jgi:hypothetical protein